jgi:tol-pal system protein YbgF
MDAMHTDFRSRRSAPPRTRAGLGLLLGPWLAAVACGVGCSHQRAGAVGGRLAPSADGQGQGVEVQALREALRERDERLKQLESRLALVEAEQRQFRYAIEDLSHVSPAPAPKVDAPKRGALEPSAPAEPARRAALREEPRVVLRLHEEGVRPARSEPEERTRDRIVLSDDRPRDRAGLQEVPVVSERLPVAPLPSAAALAMGVAPIPTAPVRALPVAEPRAAVNDDAYAAALDALAARDFRNASALFERFMGEHPRDPRFAKAAYWRAEALFALHSYAAARAGFEAYLGAAPQGERAPDAWLKLGHARARSGDTTGAKAAFRELRSRFPNSAAARMSAEEEP